MSVGDNYPLRQFLEAPKTILGAFAFFALSAGAGQLLFFLCGTVVEVFWPSHSVRDGLQDFWQGIPPFPDILWGILWLPILAVFFLFLFALSGIGIIFLVVDFVCLFRLLYTEIPLHTFFFRVSGAQLGAYFFMALVLKGYDDKNMVVLLISLCVWVLTFWLVKRRVRIVDASAFSMPLSEAPRNP
jgi:hypothetical protein